MKEFKNCHAGQSAIIVGNGPSLKNTPLEELTDYVTFGMNRINEIFDETSWRPDYYLFQGQEKHRRYRHDALEVIEDGITTFIQEDKANLYPNRDNIVFFPRLRYNTEEILEYVGVDSLQSINNEDIIKIVNEFWSIDVTDGVYSYSNSMIPMAQIVAYMGFNEIYFIGCDGYIQQKPHIIFESGSDPLEHPEKYDNKFVSYVNFIFSDRKPVRSFVNGLSYYILKSETTPFWIKSKFSENNYFTEDYHRDIERFWRYQKRNIRLQFVHRIIEEAGILYNFKTYNATIDGNIDIHTPITIEKMGIP